VQRKKGGFSVSENSKVFREEMGNDLQLVDVLSALTHACNSLMLRIAAVDMDDNGQSPWLNMFVVDITGGGNSQCLSEPAKKYLCDMAAAVEHTLRGVASLNLSQEEGGQG